MEAANAERDRYEAEKLRLFYRVRDAYYEYYYLARAIAVVRENRNLLQYLEGVARTRYKADAAGHPDVIRAQVELARLDDRLHTLEDLRGALVARLDAALGRPADAPLPWPKSAPYEPTAATDDQVLAWLRDASPELRALAHEIAGRRKAIDLAKKGYFPDVNLGVDYIDTAGARMPGVDDSGKDPVVAMVSINIPLWVEKYAAGVREAEARHWAALKSRADRENTLSGEVKMVLYRYRDAQRKIGLYRDTLVPKAQESLKATETAFRTGRAAFTDLVDAERILLEFGLASERALADHGQRLAELEMLIGREVPRAAAAPRSGKAGGPTEDGTAEGDKR
jgi:cobalt-zinc-cadmium efflux system outer membrane protein